MRAVLLIPLTAPFARIQVLAAKYHLPAQLQAVLGIHQVYRLGNTLSLATSYNAAAKMNNTSHVAILETA
jgi:hypothetical protein